MITLWKLWFVGFVVLVILVGGSFLANLPYHAPLKLAPGTEVSISVFRFFENIPEITLEFDRPTKPSTPDKSAWLRPELGEFGHYDDAQNHGYIDFPNPGQPIQLLVKSDKISFVAQALPASSYGLTIGRDMWPLEQNETQYHVRWPRLDQPGMNKSNMTLSAGHSTLHITVLEVGELLKGEIVDISIKSPEHINLYSPGFFGYAAMMVFTFWGGIIAFFWAALGACLLIVTIGYFTVKLWASRKKS